MRNRFVLPLIATTLISANAVSTSAQREVRTLSGFARALFARLINLMRKAGERTLHAVPVLVVPPLDNVLILLFNGFPARRGCREYLKGTAMIGAHKCRDQQC